MFTLASYLLRDREDAGDVVQETLMKLWANMDEVEEAKVGPWVGRVLRNACIDALRARGAYRDRFVPSPGEDFDPAGPGITPDRHAEASDLCRHIDAALERMNEPYRSILFLREMDECTYEEISQALDLPMSTVKVYLHRARKMVRASLKHVITDTTYAA